MNLVSPRRRRVFDGPLRERRSDVGKELSPDRLVEQKSAQPRTSLASAVLLVPGEHGSPCSRNSLSSDEKSFRSD